MHEPTSGTLSRRTIARTAVVASTAAATVVAGESALAATAYPPAKYTKTPLPSPAARHMANRFAYGYTPALRSEMAAAGGPLTWFERQLAPSQISDTAANAFASWWPTINATPKQVYAHDRNGSIPGWQAMANYQRWTLLRRMYSKRQVHEVMTEFWENHLHVAANGDAAFGYRVAYGKTIRQHALGRFDQMLVAAITHPAMGIYLDNAGSTKEAPNENLGRELLELHTVGVGAFTETDVKNSARILTGWTVDLWNTWTASYDPSAHWTGPVKVLGFRDPNASRDGRALTRRYLTYLAHHPRTAQRIARKLAVRFVSDNPPQSLVDTLARVYLDHDTAIKPVLRALVRSTAFNRAAGAKVRTPAEDLVATYRALGVKIARPTSGESAANQIVWQCQALGMAPYDWTQPSGQPDGNAAWSSTSRMLASFRTHYEMSGGWWPRKNATYRPYDAWLPQASLRFDLLVDHLSRRLLGRPSTSALLKACCQATGCRPAEKITRSHAVANWKMPRLLTTVLDTPAHLSR